MASIDIASLNRQGKVFNGANVSAKSVIAVTTAMTGLILWNPPSSRVKLVLLSAGFVYTTAPTAATQIGVAVAASTTVLPTSLTVAGAAASAADGSGNVGQGVVWDAATLTAAPVARYWFQGSCGTAVTTATLNQRLDGEVILVPGATACLTTVTTTAVGMGSFSWAELSV